MLFLRKVAAVKYDDVVNHNFIKCNATRARARTPGCCYIRRLGEDIQLYTLMKHSWYLRCNRSWTTLRRAFTRHALPWFARGLPVGQCGCAIFFVTPTVLRKRLLVPITTRAEYSSWLVFAINEAKSRRNGN